MSWVGRRFRRQTLSAGRIVLLTTVTAATVLVTWLSGPALSSGPYVPEPVEFELREGVLGGGRVAAAGRNGAALRSSRVLTTPKRFNLVGLRWKGARSVGLRMRVRLRGEDWSRWVEARVDPDHGPDRAGREENSGWVVSDPVWAGEADQLEYAVRASKPLRDVRIHFVNSTGTATKLDRLRSGLRGAVATAVATVGSVFSADANAQGSSQPEIVTREQWGADACPRRATPAYGEVKLAFIHHTVTANEYTPDQSAAMVLGICRYHRNSNGWNDIGYQFLVDKYGRIFEGRAGGIDRPVVGAQAQGYNSQSTGISNLGTFSTSGQSEEGLAALAHLLSWKLAIHGVVPQGKVTVRSGGGATNRYPAGAAVTFDAISGHREADRTACPGDGLYAQLPRLRSMVGGDTRAAAKLALGAQRRNVPYGRKARLSGSLTAADGSPLAGRPIQVQSLSSASGVRTLTSARTTPAGTFALNLKLSFNRTLQARFGGDPALRPTLSVPLTVGVRPRLTATLGARGSTQVAAGRRVVVTGTVRPRKRVALLIVDRRATDGEYRRILKRSVRVRRGRIFAARRFTKPGRYRLRLGVDRDARNLSSRSDPLEITVG